MPPSEAGVQYERKKTSSKKKFNIGRHMTCKPALDFFSKSTPVFYTRCPRVYLGGSSLNPEQAFD
jgi:hypothetical protein